MQFLAEIEYHGTIKCLFCLSKRKARITFVIVSSTVETQLHITFPVEVNKIVASRFEYVIISNERLRFNELHRIEDHERATIFTLRVCSFQLQSSSLRAMTRLGHIQIEIETMPQAGQDYSMYRNDEKSLYARVSELFKFQ